MFFSDGSRDFSKGIMIVIKSSEKRKEEGELHTFSASPSRPHLCFACSFTFDGYDLAVGKVWGGELSSNPGWTTNKLHVQR